jgi:hypothetical protein
LFFGDESLRFFAVRIKQAKKILCTVHLPPFATFGRVFLSLSKYTTVDIKVAVCTCDLWTNSAMNLSIDGM